MAKNIHFFADGTWNAPDQDENGDGEPDPTNVVKLFGMLRGSDDVASIPLRSEQERVYIRDGRTEQVAKYIHGVGDSRNWLVRMFGGVFGAGVVTRIARGYTFLSRHYEPGDRIFLAGFSRGAYTVRSLAGMIGALGLLDRRRVDCDDRQESYRNATAAWDHYRERRMRPGQECAFADVVRDMPGFVHDRTIAAKLTGPLAVHCIGVWDTVGSLGIPLYDERDARIDSLQFCDCKASDRVRSAYHAVAIDELRADFTPTLWEPREGIEQVLFAGAHADVGGGHPMVRGESELAHLALLWMRERFEHEGALFKGVVPAEYAASHRGGSHQPWLDKVWLTRRRAHRRLANWQADGLRLHESVVARLEGQGSPFPLYPSGHVARYRPPSIDL